MGDMRYREIDVQLRERAATRREESIARREEAVAKREENTALREQQVSAPRYPPVSVGPRANRTLFPPAPFANDDDFSTAAQYTPTPTSRMKRAASPEYDHRYASFIDADGVDARLSEGYGASDRVTKKLKRDISSANEPRSTSANDETTHAARGPSTRYSLPGLTDSAGKHHFITKLRDDLIAAKDFDEERELVMKHLIGHGGTLDQIVEDVKAVDGAKKLPGWVLRWGIWIGPAHAM